MSQASLPYQITFEDQTVYLKAYVSGPKDTLEISLQFWKDIQQKVNEVGAKRLMVIEDFPNQLSGGEVFQVAKALPDLFPRKRLAFVDLSLSNHDINKMGEDVAVNRGLVGKVFNDPAKADQWLREEEV